MVKVQNGQLVPLSQALGGQLDDNKDKKLKFEQEKDVNIPTFSAKGKDKQVYGFSLADIMVTVTVSPEPNLKEQRKQGWPMPKDDAKKADQEIKEEKKAAKEARKKAREDAKKAGAITEAEADRQEKEEEEAEKEESGESSEEDANPTLQASEKSSGRRAR